MAAEGGLESSRGSPGQQTEYQVDIGQEEETLETIDPTWRTTCWLQLVVQGIPDDEVPWAKCIIPLTVGTEDVAVPLAKRLLAIWRWSIKVQGWDVCPPAPMALNIGQFMTWEEVLENVDNSLWFTAYSCTLQRVREAVHSRRWQGGRRRRWESLHWSGHFGKKQVLSSPPPAQNFVGNFPRRAYSDHLYG